MVTSRAAYLAFLLLLGAERLFEVALSRRNAARALARGGRESGRAHFPAMVALHTTFLASCAVESGIRPFPGALGWVALAGAAFAQALRYWAVASLGDRWNVRVIVVPGDAPVQRGPYRFVRHPNYAAVVLEMLAVPLIHGCWLTAAVFSALHALVLRVRIRAEEAALGASWQDAFAGRGRFFPGGPGRG
jgi:methyltransferase